MSIKVFSGLGLNSTINRQVLDGGSVSNIDFDNSTVIVDIVRQEDISIVKTDSESENQSAASGFEIVDIVEAENKPITIFSRESSYAPFNTLFDDFDLKATPYYNFYVEDEEYNDKEVVGDRNLQDVPRYILLTWNIAPDLRPRDPSRTKKKRNATKNADRINSFFEGGIIFSPEHLNDFSLIKNSISNGFLNPGSISGVIEKPIEGDFSFKRPRLSEEQFLISEKTDGLAANELQANIDTLVGGSRLSAEVYSDVNSGKESLIKDDLFSGNYYINKLFNGTLEIKGVQSSSPNITVRTTVSSERSTLPGLLNDSDLVSIQNDIKPRAINVNFSDSRITGLLSENRINSFTKPEHAENLLSLGQFLPNLEVLNTVDDELLRDVDIPTFRSPSSLPDLEYVGYIIEKYKMKNNGSFELIDEIDIEYRDVDSYVDSEVTYGSTYRYRIKCIIRWTRDEKIGVDGITKSNILSDRFHPARPLSRKVSSYFESEWGNEWAYSSVIDMNPPDYPDEFTVRPESHRKRALVYWKAPYNPQKDISHFMLFKKLQTDDGRDITNWSRIGPIFPFKNSIFIDNDVDFFQENGNIRYVYAAMSFSRHNERSPLSDQIAVKLNKDFKYLSEYDVIFVSEGGVFPEQHGIFSVKPSIKRSYIINSKDKLMIKQREGIFRGPSDNKNYKLRLTSLDTGVVKDIDIITDYINVGEFIDEHVETVVINTEKPPKNFESAKNIDNIINDTIASIDIGINNNRVNKSNISNISSYMPISKK